MEFDYIIIGSGPAGSILSKELSDSGFKVALIDRAQNKGTSSINDFFCPYIDNCPKYYTPVFSNTLGGNSELWHSKVYLLSEDEIKKYNWNIDYKEILNFSNILTQKFKINDELITKSQKINSFSKYIYSLRADFRNVFKFLKIDQSNNISLYKGYSPTEILFKDKIAESLIISDNKKSTKKINFKKAIIFCAGGLGNPHLLLNLTNNCSKLLGKYLSDHPHVNLGKVNINNFEKFKKIAKPNILKNLNLDSNEIAFVHNKNNVFAASQLDYKTDPIRKLKRLFIRIKNINLRKFLNIFSFIILKLNGLFYKFGLIIGRYNKYSFEYFFSQSPKLNNYVSLSQKKDEFGLKKININWDVNQDDKEIYNEIINNNIGKNGIFFKTKENIEFEKPFYRNGLAGLHPSCTTKIGDSPDNGVVNSDLKLFNYDNIYVCGSSVFPFNGYTNPTWTIMTLALRLSEKLKKKHI